MLCVWSEVESARTHVDTTRHRLEKHGNDQLYKTPAPPRPHVVFFWNISASTASSSPPPFLYTLLGGLLPSRFPFLQRQVRKRITVRDWPSRRGQRRLLCGSSAAPQRRLGLLPAMQPAQLLEGRDVGIPETCPRVFYLYSMTESESEG